MMPQPEPEAGELVVVTGMTGAGRSTAAIPRETTANATIRPRNMTTGRYPATRAS